MVTDDLRVNDRLVIPAAELDWRFSRASGPGGQGVNTTDSRVELSWDLAGSAVLSPLLRARAQERLAGRLVDGVRHRGGLGVSLPAAQPGGRGAAAGGAGGPGGRTAAPPYGGPPARPGARSSGGWPARSATARSNATGGDRPSNDPAEYRTGRVGHGGLRCGYELCVAGQRGRAGPAAAPAGAAARRRRQHRAGVGGLRGVPECRSGRHLPDRRVRLGRLHPALEPPAPDLHPATGDRRQARGHGRRFLAARVLAGRPGADLRRRHRALDEFEADTGFYCFDNAEDLRSGETDIPENLSTVAYGDGPHRRCRAP